MNHVFTFGSSASAIVQMIVAALIWTYPSARAQSPGPTPKTGPAISGNAQNGNRLFRTVGCWACHGYVGQGGRAGSRIGPPAIPLAAFVAYNRQPKGQMPPYAAKIIPESDLADIYAYLQSVPKPPPAKSIPLLNN
jgi:mono/diheme cytochrome c family protein